MVDIPVENENCTDKFTIVNKAGKPDVRHQKALEEAVEKIQTSDICQLVSDVILYGSCARGDQHWDSDIDLLLVVKPEMLEMKEYRRKLNTLRGELRSEYIFDPDIDVHITQAGWEKRTEMYYKEISREGRSVW